MSAHDEGRTPSRQGEPARLVLAPAADPLLPLLERAALLLLKHPAAAQAAFSALVAEGRDFARTEEGRRWKSALAGSEIVRRGRALWEGSVLSLLEDREEAVLPTALLDAVVQAAGRRDLTTLLQSLRLDEEPDADARPA
jgi:hypothetical protein